jgi:hypothetical protein
LSKSRKDAEDERKERLAVTQAQRNSRRPDKRWQDEENEPVDYLELEEQGVPLDAVSIEKYLTYNSPMIASFPVHSFVTAALSIARTYDILPNYSLSREVVNGSIQALETTQFRTFHIPIAVSEVLQENWKERIRHDVVRARERRIHTHPTSVQLPEMTTIARASAGEVSSYHDPINNEATRAAVIDNTFADVAMEFDLNEDQLRAYHYFTDALKSILMMRNAPKVEVKDCCMYLGGAGGTGKSRVIKAIVDAFARIGCGEKLFVTATTGVAATLINGSTIDSLCKLKGSTGDDDDDEVPFPFEMIDNIWGTCDFLILCSRVPKSQRSRKLS